MTRSMPTALALAAALLAGPAAAQIIFYEHDEYRGRTYATDKAVPSFRGTNFNDRASSVVVERGRWEVCDSADFGGNCTVLRPGNYPSLTAMGLNDQVSSTRRASDRRAALRDAPPPVTEQPYEYRRRPNERLYEARVTSSRAVVGEPTQRCWIESQQVESRGDPSVARGVLGAVLGGVLGHQVGGGSGRDIATVGGAVAGAAIGANTGRGERGTTTQDVRRCENVASTEPAYWDVGYTFRGVQHRIQMTSRPGDTISVNRAGEPRQ